MQQGMQGILVTGASGFIGHALSIELLRCGYSVLASFRQSAGMSNLAAGVTPLAVASIDGDTNWRGALTSCDAVIHLAARVHVSREQVSDQLAAYRAVNAEGTLNLARQAAQEGVRRFIFISSIGVNGTETFHRPFAADDRVSPSTPYAVSKYEAEMGLRAISSETGMDVVIIRPPLVYGARAPGSFALLLRWIQRGLPLPLGAVDNKRSLVALDNLLDLIVTCIQHPAAANQVLLVSDGEDLSTPDLIRRMAAVLNKPTRILAVPPPLLQWGAQILGKADMAKRLFTSLQVDISKTRLTLGWVPPIKVNEGLRRALVDGK